MEGGRERIGARQDKTKQEGKRDLEQTEENKRIPKKKKKKKRKGRRLVI